MSKMFDYLKVDESLEYFEKIDDEITLKIDFETVDVPSTVPSRDKKHYIGVLSIYDILNKRLGVVETDFYKSLTGAIYAIDKLAEHLKSNGWVQHDGYVFDREFEDIITVHRAMKKLGFDSLDQFNTNLRLGDNYRFRKTDVVYWLEDAKKIKLIHDDAIIHEFDKE